MNVAEMMLSHHLVAVWMLFPRPRLWLDDMYYPWHCTSWQFTW